MAVEGARACELFRPARLLFLLSGSEGQDGEERDVRNSTVRPSFATASFARRSP